MLARFTFIVPERQVTSRSLDALMIGTTRFQKRRKDEGIGYTMLIVSVMRVIGKGRLGSVALTHVVLSMNKVIPWANCDFIKDGSPCISTAHNNVSLDMVKQSCCKTKVNEFNICPDAERLLLPFSARLWNEQEFFNKTFSVEKDGLGSLHPYLTSILIGTWLVVFVALQRKINILNYALVPMGIIIGIMFVTLSMVTFIAGGNHALLLVDCVEKALESLHMICGTFVIYSSYAPKQSNPITTTVVVGFLKSTITIIVMLIYSAFGGIIAQRLGAPPVCVQNVGWASWQANPGQFFGSLPYPQVWSIMYYLLLFLTDLVYVVLLLFAVIETVLEANPKFREYYLYIVMGLCFVCFLGGVPLTAESGTHTNLNIQLVNMDIGTLNLGLYAVVIMWVYGVVRLADDIQFYTGKLPSKFWSYMWYFSPIPIFLILVPRAYAELRDMHDTGSKIMQPLYLGIAVLIACPIPIIAIYQCTVYFKARRLLMVILPTREWGPNNKEDKRRRLHFNPRKIVRFHIEAPLKYRPPGLLPKKQLKMENDRLEAHRKIFLEYIYDKEEEERAAATEEAAYEEYESDPNIVDKERGED